MSMECFPSEVMTRPSLTSSSVFQHVQRVLPNIPAVPVCDGKTRLTPDQHLPRLFKRHHNLFSYVPSSCCVGKLPECPAGPCHAGDSPPLPELDSFRLHLRDQAHQHSGLQGKAANSRPEKKICINAQIRSRSSLFSIISWWEVQIIIQYIYKQKAHMINVIIN